MSLLALLDEVSPPTGMGLKEIAELLKLKLPTAHNFLKTMVLLGYVEQQGTKYFLADKTRTLGWQGRLKDNLRQKVRSALVRLAGELDETVILTCRSGKFWQTIFKLEGYHLLTAKAELPITNNFYISATGRCILSTLPEEELKNYVDDFRLPLPSEWKSATTWEQLKNALDAIRSSGVEIIDTGYGVIGVGAALPATEDTSAGAIGVIVPSFRFNGAHKEQIFQKIRQTAQSVFKAK